MSSLKLVIYFFVTTHPTGCDVVSCRGFDLRFPQDYDVEGLFHGLTGHLCIFFGVMSIQIICSF